MKRRRLTAAGALALAAPWSARGQRGPLPVVGYLSGVSRAESEDRLTAFRRGLGQAGYNEGRNVAFEFRFADGDYARLTALAAELARLPVSLIVAVGGSRAAQAAKAATASVPIVFIHGGDPVKLGLVESLSRPGTNATGIVFLTADLLPKRFEMLRTLLPKSKRVALMVNPNSPTATQQVQGAQSAALASGTQLLVARAGSEAEIDMAFATLAKASPDALLVGTDALFGSRHKQFIALSARHSLPACYEQRSAVVDGGLMSCGPNIAEAYVQTGVYAGRMLAGARPQELPVLQPTKFELAINRGTARALGLVIPQTLLLQADEVIE